MIPLGIHFRRRIHPLRRARCLKKKLRKNNPSQRTSKNYLESILLKVYEDNMPADLQFEIISRTLDILALDFAFDDRASALEILAKKEELIGLAKVRAMQDMGILDRLEPDGQR